jgi:predicted Zn-dependent protease
MKFKIIVMSMFAAALVSCGTTSTVPITGRKHNLLVSDEQVLSLSNQEYTKYMQTAKASTNATNTAMVKRVGQRLANAVETYLRNNGMSSEINNFKWEFNLVQDKSVNAFCMRSSDLFSDHPSDSKRIAAIQNEMPEALKYYQASGYSSNGTTKSVSKTKGTSRRR